MTRVLNLVFLLGTSWAQLSGERPATPRQQVSQNFVSAVMYVRKLANLTRLFQWHLLSPFQFVMNLSAK